MGRLYRVTIDIEGVSVVSDFEVIENFDDGNPYPTLLGIDWAIDMNGVINVKKRRMSFEINSIRVIVPLDPAEGLCRIRAILREVPWRSTVVENNLIMTSTRSSSSSSSSALKTSACSSCALIWRPHFYLHTVSRGSFHHHLIAFTMALIVAHRFTKITKQLLRCLNKLLKQVVVINHMLPSDLTNGAP